MPYRKPRPRDPRRYNAELKFAAFCPPRTDGFCRCGCGKKLEGRQRQWRHGHEAKPLRDFRILKGDVGVIRDAVFERDHGVCAGCGLDTVAEAEKCRLWKWDAAPAERELAMAMRERYMLAGFPSPLHQGRNWWQADHILPVVEGGANALENLRTMCLACHKRETRRLAARRAKSKAPDNTLSFPFDLPNDRLTANLP